MRYQGKVLRIYFRADAAFAMRGVYECLEAERIKYAIRVSCPERRKSAKFVLIRGSLGESRIISTLMMAGISE